MNKENKVKRSKVKDCSQYADQTNKRIVIRIRKIQKLLLVFGAKAYAFDPGVRCYITTDISSSANFGHNIDFGHNEWKWLRPLLEELLEYRKRKRKK